MPPFPKTKASQRTVLPLCDKAATTATVAEEHDYRTWAAECDMPLTEYARRALTVMRQAALKVPVVLVPVVPDEDDRRQYSRRSTLLAVQRQADGLPPLAPTEVARAASTSDPYTVRVRPV